MVLHIIINFIVVAPRPPSGKDQPEASPRVSFKPNLVKTTQRSFPRPTKSRLSKYLMQLVMGRHQYIEGDQSLLLWDWLTAGVIKIKLGISAATLRRTEQGDTQFSKSFPRPTKSRLSKYQMQLVMGLVNSRRSNNKKSSLCSDFAKNGAKRELFLLFIELSQSNRAPSQAEKSLTQMLL